VDHLEAQPLADLLKAVAHPTRLQILAELSKGAKCVTAITDILPSSQANVSQHLTVLRHAGLIDFVQEGALRCYYVARPTLVNGLLRLLSGKHEVIKRPHAKLGRRQWKGGAARD